MKTAIRVFTIVVVLAIIAVAAIPMLVLADLLGDGDGWGLCPNGLGSCRTSYFHGPELFAMLIIALLGLVLLLRVAFRADRVLTRQQEKKQRRAQVIPPLQEAGRRRRW